MPIGIWTACLTWVLTRGMARRSRRGKQPAGVTVEYILAPGAEERLRRAFDLVLKAAARAEEEPAEENTPIHDTEHEEADGGR